MTTQHQERDGGPNTTASDAETIGTANISFTREEKVLHEEWVDLKFSASDVLANPEVFTSDVDDWEAEHGVLHSHPTLFFEHGTICVDEMWGVRSGRVFTSSYDSGVCNWDDGSSQYVKHFHGRSSSLGQFVAAEFREVSWLTERLKQLAARLPQEEEK